MAFTLFSIGFVMALVSFVTRGIAIYRFRSTSPDLWSKLGSPELGERDYFFAKYPFYGWRLVFARSTTPDRLVLIVFAISSAAAITSILAALLCRLAGP